MPFPEDVKPFHIGLTAITFNKSATAVNATSPTFPVISDDFVAGNMWYGKENLSYSFRRQILKINQISRFH